MDRVSNRNNVNPIDPSERGRVLARVYAFILSWPEPQQGESGSQDCPDKVQMDSSKSERGG
jgi:hypothetical protein